MFDLELANAIWLFVAVFMLHDFEEIIAVENWSKKMEMKMKNTNNWVKKQIWKIWNVNSHSFAKRDVFIFLTISSITFMKTTNLDSPFISIIYLSFLIFVFIHNIAHILQTVMLKAYTPGYFTSLFLVSPYTVYLFIRLVP